MLPPLRPRASEIDVTSPNRHLHEGSCRIVVFHVFSGIYGRFVCALLFIVVNSEFLAALVQVHREQGNYKESSEAANRAQKAAPTSAILCKAVTRLTECKDFTEPERVNYVRNVWLEIDALPSDSTVGSVSRQHRTSIIAPNPNCVIFHVRVDISEIFPPTTLFARLSTAHVTHIRVEAEANVFNHETRVCLTSSLNVRLAYCLCRTYKNGSA